MSAQAIFVASSRKIVATEGTLLSEDLLLGRLVYEVFPILEHTNWGAVVDQPKLLLPGVAGHGVLMIEHYYDFIIEASSMYSSSWRLSIIDRTEHYLAQQRQQQQRYERLLGDRSIK